MSFTDTSLLKGLSSSALFHLSFAYKDILNCELFGTDRAPSFSPESEFLRKEMSAKLSANVLQMWAESGVNESQDMDCKSEGAVYPGGLH